MLYEVITQVLKTDKVSQKDFMIDTADWSEGVYFIRFKSETLHSTLRLIKN